MRKSLTVLTLASLMLPFAACTTIPPIPGSGGSGGGGAGGDAGGGSGAGGAGGMIGGDAFLCDDGTSGTDDISVCTECTNCAAIDPCSKQFERCTNSTLCTAFADCLNGCGKTGGNVDLCTDGCVASNPEGASVFEIGQNCALCECPNNCDNLTITCQDVTECDDGQIPPVDEFEICNACVTCAAEGPCKPSSDVCGASTECDDFSNCEIQCVNDGGTVESCSTTCAVAHPAGAVLARDNATCICAHCPDNCTGAPGCDFY